VVTSRLFRCELSQFDRINIWKNCWLLLLRRDTEELLVLHDGLRLSGSKTKSGGQRVTPPLYDKYFDIAKRRKSSPMPVGNRSSLGGVREIQGDSARRKMAANVSRKRSEGGETFCYRQAVASNGDLSYEKTSSHPYLRGKRKPAGPVRARRKYVQI